MKPEPVFILHPWEGGETMRPPTPFCKTRPTGRIVPPLRHDDMRRGGGTIGARYLVELPERWSPIVSPSSQG